MASNAEESPFVIYEDPQPQDRPPRPWLRRSRSRFRLDTYGNLEEPSPAGPSRRNYRLDSYGDIRRTDSPSPSRSRSPSRSPTRYDSSNPSQSSRSSPPSSHPSIATRASTPSWLNPTPDPDPGPGPGPLTELPQARATRSKELTRDDKVGIQFMKRYTNWNTSRLAAATPFTRRQVQHALETPPTPQKSKPHPSKRRLDDEQLETLRRFLDEDRSHRYIAWQDLRFFVPGFWEIGPDAISTGMKTLGFQRRVQRKTLKTSRQIREARIAMCEELLEKWPEAEDWLNAAIAFSDEAFFVTVNRGIRTVTVHETEDPKTFERLQQKGVGLMFWGVICGRYKGPGWVFPRGMSVTARTYRLAGLRLANNFLWQLRQLHPGKDIRFMQDGAGVHRAAFTRAWINVYGINIINWAPWSPDLNPIENVWALMKLWIDDNYDIEQLSQSELYGVIQEAWEAIPEEKLVALARGMPDRLRKCIANEGYPIDK